ncbi:MAG: DUF262 domain-containing protein [Gammaproteobacteria bacterium]|nr:DUF262 domain-containing protein [Gammaproteobacteria bacterium]MBU1731859.1 DUF262 domain-containing protein [Gammaproteobacteria bacterium]MBU1892470.1 DUF262 domain-containing protein [Gammaproteobacteria bacterium]
MATTKDVIQHIRDEDNDAYSDDSLFNIKPWGADLSFRELIQRYDDDELVKPELQRKYVWDRAEASRFIDSLLLGLPVPSIFLAQTQDEKLLIIDGYQRIMTVYDYVNGIFSRDGKSFSLSRSEKINSRWRGKNFLELSDTEQRRVRNTTIHAIIFAQQQPSQDDTSLFQVFERINTSGRTLLSQEIRNCVAQGNFNSLLFSLNDYGPWRALFGLNEPDARMRDMEFILRFYALTSEAYRTDTREKISLRRFLDLYMKANANIPQNQIDEMRQRFISAIDLVMSSFGGNAFHNVSPTDSTRFVPKFSPTIFDSTLIAADYALRVGGITPPQNPGEARRELLLDPEYRLAISQETMKRDSIYKRISMACQHLFGINYEQP